VTPLLAAGLAISHWLARHGWPACIIGGLAVQRWGEPRFTRDVDVTALVGFGPEERFVDACLSAFEPARQDARDFALRYRVLLLKAESGVPIDIALGAIPFEAETIERATAYEFEPGGTLLTCSAEDLIIHKVIAGRPRDIGDVEGVVGRQLRRLDFERIRSWLRAFSEVADERDLAGDFERVVARVARRLGEG
jgi:hypothetical protein